MRFRAADERDRIVTVGEVMAVLLARVGEPLGEASRFDLDAAGAEATVAAAAVRLGRPATLVTQVGADALGDQVLGRLRGIGVDVVAGRHQHSPTGMLVRDAVADRPVTVRYYRTGSAACSLSAEDIPEDLVAGAGLLHLTAITAVISDSARQAVVRAARIARAHGVPVSFDPNVRLSLAPPDRWREVVEELATLADLVLTGLDDAAVLTDGPAHPWFLDRGAGVVVTKDGARGATETDGTYSVSVPARPAVLVDPVGAGDAFAGAWLDGWLAGLRPEARMERAAAVAALCVGARGDLTGLPSRAVLERVLTAAGEVDR